MKICRRRGRWVLDYAYEDEQGKRQRVRSSFVRREEAEHEAGDVRRKLSRGSYVRPTKLPTFGEVGDDWERGKEQHRPASRAQWHTHREHLNSVAQVRLDQIDVARVERLRGALSTKGLAPQTVNKILTTGAAIFALAQRRGLIERNPFALVERLRIGSGELTPDADAPRGDGRVRPEDVPTTDEVRRVLVQLAPGRDRTLILLDAGCGLRPGELFGLQWSCVDLDAGQLHVRRSVSWARLPGETGPARSRVFPPKTRAGVRTLPLAPELLHEMKVWKLECRPTENDLAFPSERATPLHRSTVLRTVLYPACDRAEVRRFNLKALRHYFASSLITAGVPITRVAQLMGHSSPLVTLNVYAHWLRDQETSGIAELARALCAETTTASTSAGPAGAATPTAARGHKMVTVKGGRSRSTR